MITQFNTSPATASKGSNTLVYLIVGAVVLYLGYKYIIKPELSRREQEKKQQ